MKRLVAAIAGASLLAAAPMAQAADAARTAAPMDEASELGGNSTLLVLLGVVAFGALVFLLAGGDESPDSP